MSNYKKPVWSFSGVNLYRTCPNQYRAKNWTKEIKFAPTQHTIWGNECHTALEKRIGEKVPLADRFVHLETYAQTIEKLKGEVSCELELAITEDLKPCGYWDKNAWFRGKLDVLVDQGDKAIITDWKTGTAKPNDFNELRAFSMLTFANRPEVEKTKNVYIWLKKDSPPTSEIVARDKMQELVDDLGATIQQIEHSMETDTWKPRPSGLCGQWCDVVSCKHNGRHRG